MRLNRVSTFTLLVAGSLIMSACDEIDIPVIVDSEEIIRYISESDDAIALFRNTNIIPEDQYTFADEPGVIYFDVDDSVKREISVDIITEQMSQNGASYVQDFGPPISVSRDAEATVVDNFYVTKHRIEGTDSSETSSRYTLTRYGYFIKIGDDSKAFVGWKLMGFGGGGTASETRVLAEREDATTFWADSVLQKRNDYLLIDVSRVPWDTLGPDTLPTTYYTDHVYLDITGEDGIAVISDGEALEFSVTTPVVPPHYTVAGETDNGFHKYAFVPGDDSILRVTINTVDNNQNPLNILIFQHHNLTNKMWCIPYRVSD
ncbi:MAG: hypothetical protein AB1483_13770 [Candidatus Zixiibacteriota bacterium]